MNIFLVILKLLHFEPLNVVAGHQILPIVLVYTCLIVCLSSSLASSMDCKKTITA